MAFECPVCFKKFEQRSNFIRHKNKHDGKVYTCEICQKQFNDSSNLKKHVRGVHIKIAEHKCELCDAVFKQKTHLQAHQLTHSNVKDFICGICGKDFSRKKVLETHLRTHTQDKMFQCNFCSMAFNHKASLEYHMGKHMGKMSFSCEACGRKFDRKANFLRHKLTHSDEKPYKCDVCSKGFIQKTLLDNHHQKCHQLVEGDSSTVRQIDTSNRMRNPPKESYIYQCEKCDKKFNAKGNLNRHVRDKHEDKPDQYVCHLCMNTYISKTFLDGHLKADHGVSDSIISGRKQTGSAISSSEHSKYDDNEADNEMIHDNNDPDPLQLVYSSVNIEKFIQTNETEKV